MPCAPSFRQTWGERPGGKAKDVGLCVCGAPPSVLPDISPSCGEIDPQLTLGPISCLEQDLFQAVAGGYKQRQS